VRGKVLELVEMDERLLSGPDHKDICMRVRSLGGLVMMEPKALVTYLWPAGKYALKPEDLDYYNFIWGDTAKFHQAIDVFGEIWQAQVDPIARYWADDCASSHQRLAHGGEVELKDGRLIVKGDSHVID